VRQPRAKSRTAAPEKTPRAPTETEAASAWGCSDTRGGKRGGSGACLGGCARRPDRQRRGCGSGAEKHQREWERVTESEHAEHDEACQPAHEPAAEDERPRLRRAGERGRARAQPAAEPEAQGAFASGEAWQCQDHRGGCDPGSRYDRERGTRSNPGSREGDGDGGERRQRGAVDQTEHDQREADCPQTGRTTWVAAHDRDPHRIVEAAGKDDTDHRRAAVTGDERKRRGPLAVRKQPCPPECLERLGKEKQQPGSHEQAWLAVRGGHEVVAK
jgi:hypothetical protein